MVRCATDWIDQIIEQGVVTSATVNGAFVDGGGLTNIFVSSVMYGDVPINAITIGTVVDVRIVGARSSQDGAIVSIGRLETLYEE